MIFIVHYYVPEIMETCLDVIVNDTLIIFEEPMDVRKYIIIYILIREELFKPIVSRVECEIWYR